MIARLVRLRIAGFKSFAEPVSLDILPGLTGIVGPNGCGKSNVVEALRWAMGETSARSLRGGEMDDVIFAGTTARAGRNLAEVTITLQASPDRPLPNPFEAETELQVTRRIERGAGSQYRAAGREQRARDIQTLYADMSSGARSSGMVSQGRVSQLVNAKPEERRQVLEEAAGITGLHARRHEAEIKLRAAEANLARAEDLRIQLQGSADGLRKQARQAARYRNISGLIRAAEAEHLAVLLAAARAQLEAARQATEAADRAQREARQEAEIAGQALDDAEAALPAPREALAEAARLLERRRMDAEGLAAESERVTRAAAEAEHRVVELTADLAAAERHRADCGASVARLEAVTSDQAARIAALPPEIDAAAKLAREAKTAEQAAHAHAGQAQAAAQAAWLAASQAKAALASAETRLAAMRVQHHAATSDRAEAEAAIVDLASLATSQHRIDEAATGLGKSRDRLDLAEAATLAAMAAHTDAKAASAQARAARLAAAAACHEAEARAETLAKARDAAASGLAALIAARLPADQAERLHADAARAGADAGEAEAALDAAEGRAARARQQAAETTRRHEDLRAAQIRAAGLVADLRARAGRLRTERLQADRNLAEIIATAPGQQALQAASVSHAEAGQAALAAAAAWRHAQTRHEQDAAALLTARTAAQEAQAELARLAGEIAGLAEALLGDSGEDGILAALVVPEGLDSAIGAAIGEAGQSSLDPATSRFWREMGADADTTRSPNLPEGCQALSDLVGAPIALARFLAHIALLPDGADGDTLQASLSPGTIAVRRDGAAWRWDGHVTRPGAPNAASRRLSQHRRLEAARQCHAGAVTIAARQNDCLADAVGAELTSAAALRQAAEQATRAEAVLRAMRDEDDRLRNQAAHAETRQVDLQAAAARLHESDADAETALQAAMKQAAGLGDDAQAHGQAHSQAIDAAISAEEAEAALEGARRNRQHRRTALAAAEEAARRAQAKAADTEARIEASAPALADLQSQAETAARRHAEALSALAASPDPAEADMALLRAAGAEAGCRAAEDSARDARMTAERALDTARAQDAALRAARAASDARLAALTIVMARAQSEMAQAEADFAQCQAGLAGLADAQALSAAADQANAALDAARLAVQTTRGDTAALEAQLQTARSEAEKSAMDLAGWRARLADAAGREAALAARRQAARDAWRELAAAPDAITGRAARAGAALTQAEANHEAAGFRANAADQKARALAMALRDAEQRQAACREASLRADAAEQAAQGTILAVQARAAERLEGADIPITEDVSEAAEEHARRRFERLTREREEMGPVNLRAELELSELEERSARLEQEREELTTAIARLRGAIGHLNREGRERLTAVFTRVDQHFRTLFTRMMGGGRAHLALTGSEDPLVAGLEIFAEPPGKKLAALSLLSGGEQALTALSLIFAVFRCTPAPISVLDEVDAPLDDANVERFCTLLDEIVRDTGTRFLVVTHHQLTMSRMDRLFGVTMQERGVSRLLSVDLRQAESLVAA